METKPSMAKEGKPNRGVPRLPTDDALRSRARIQPQELEHTRLLVPQALFERTLGQLAERSAGWRESAAIWIGSLDGEDAFASEVLFHHELCEDNAGPLSLELSEQAKFDLYRTLALSGRKIVSLIHTHPRDWVGLSAVDEDNQICSRIGFWSLVVPWYGREPWALERIGVHARTNDGWYEFRGSEISRRVVLV